MVDPGLCPHDVMTTGRSVFGIGLSAKPLGEPTVKVNAAARKRTHLNLLM
jgi:hypothetical protein